MRYFGLALTIIGVGLLIGTWYGHARLMILLGFLLLPFAIAASLIHVPFEGGFGSLEVRPASVDDLDAEYRLAGGQIYLDLTRVEDEGSRSRSTRASRWATCSSSFPKTPARR